jgi:hypothetical protein
MDIRGLKLLAKDFTSVRKAQTESIEERHRSVL